MLNALDTAAAVAIIRYASLTVNELDSATVSMTAKIYFRYYVGRHMKYYLHSGYARCTESVVGKYGYWQPWIGPARRGTRVFNACIKIVADLIATVFASSLQSMEHLHYPCRLAKLNDEP